MDENAVGTIEEIKRILTLVEFKEIGSVSYEFVVGAKELQPYLQAQYLEADIITGNPELQKTRKWNLSFHMVKSEIVATAFKCVMGSVEHRVRENFKYRGRRIYGPHFDVDSLWEIADRKAHLDY